MYVACRHIRINGLRCKSPALHGHAFCYFHAKLHTTAGNPRVVKLKLPLPENKPAIQLSVALISDALLNARIDSKCAGQLLYGLQIAMQTIENHLDYLPTKSLQSVTHTEDGDELAPILRICNDNDRCSQCQYAEECDNYHDDDDEEDDEDQDDDEGEDEDEDEDEGDDDEEDADEDADENEDEDEDEGEDVSGGVSNQEYAVSRDAIGKLLADKDTLSVLKVLNRVTSG